MTGSASEAPTQAQETTALARRSAVNFVGLAAANALQFGLVLLIATWLTPADAGVFFEGFAAVRLLSVVAVLGLDITAIRYVAVHRARGELDQARAAVILSVLLAGALSALITVVVFVFSPQLSKAFGDPDLDTVLRLMVLSLPAVVLQMVLIGATRGTGRMRAFVVVDQVADGVLRVALVAAALAIGTGLDGTAAAFTAAAYLTTAAAAISARRVIGRVRDALTVDIPELLRFSGNQWGASMAGVGLLWAGTLMLGYWQPPEDVAIYSIATRTVLIGMMFILPIGIAFQPQIGRLYARSDTEGLKRMYSFATKWSTLVGCPALIFVALYATPVLHVFYADSYARGAWPLALLAIGQVVSAATGPCGHIVTMIGRSDLVLKNSVAALILNLVLSVALIPPFGIVGAGLAWGISIIAWNAIRVWQVWDILHMHPFGDWTLRVGAALASFTAAAAAARVLLDGVSAPAALVVGATGATIVYAAALVAAGAFDEDDRFLPGPVARLARVPGGRPTS
jgi:O-antigen/teichoic acid export membrane protein